ncbi:MAG: phosphatase PAP2 family protein [Candidatus Nanoarchaeia archaeon]|nr:phosphatase PAP2 family protein [Candidatus Nanoarchaeia archaeon]
MKKYLIPIVLLYIILIAITFYFDPQISILTYKTHNEILTTMFKYIGLVFTSAGILLLGTLFLLKKRTLIPYFWIGYLITGLFHVLCKFVLNRARPFVSLSLSKIPEISYSFDAWNSAFPSWHTAAMFFVVPFTFKLKSKLKYVWIFLALLMSFSRMYFGFHYLSDVLAGILVGLFFGCLALLVYQKRQKGL